MSRMTYAMVAALTVLFFVPGIPTGVTAAEVRVGHLYSSTGQGVIVLIMQETNIPELIGLTAQFSDILPPSMAEGIATKRLDVEIVGDMPVTVQVARGFPIKLVALLWDFRLALFTNSPDVRSVADLSGRKLAVPFGTTAYQFAYEALKKAGLEPGKGVEVVNIAPGEIPTAIRGKYVDAFAIWDPTWVVLKRETGMKQLAAADHSGFTAVRTEFMQSNPDDVVKFLQAQILATAFRAKYPRESAERYAKRMGIKDPSIVIESQDFDRNWNASRSSDVKLEPTATDITTLKQVMDFAFSADLVKTRPTTQGLVDTTLLRRAFEKLKSSGLDVDQVKYIR